MAECEQPTWTDWTSSDDEEAKQTTAKTTAKTTAVKHKKKRAKRPSEDFETVLARARQTRREIEASTQPMSIRQLLGLPPVPPGKTLETFKPFEPKSPESIVALTLLPADSATRSSTECAQPTFTDWSDSDEESVNVCARSRYNASASEYEGRGERNAKRRRCTV